MEEEITQEEQPRPKRKLFLVVALLLGVVLLGGGGWLVYKKMGALTGGNEAEQAHREPSEVEKRAAAAQKIPLVHPFKEPPSLKESVAREDTSPPVRSGDQTEVSVDQVSMVVMEGGERRIKARLFNHGRQQLTDAQVDIRFLNSSGQLLFARAVNPLVVSGGLFGDQSEALAAGTGRQFYVLADDTPAGWTGQVDARVTGFRFGSNADEEGH